MARYRIVMVRSSYKEFEVEAANESEAVEVLHSGAGLETSHWEGD